jgi:hypothetical protein
MDPRLRGDDRGEDAGWIPAFAGMTERGCGWIAAFAGMTEEKTPEWIRAFAG